MKQRKLLGEGYIIEYAFSTKDSPLWYSTQEPATCNLRCIKHKSSATKIDSKNTVFAYITLK